MKIRLIRVHAPCIANGKEIDDDGADRWLAAAIVES
jgi:hypothetical protein